MQPISGENADVSAAGTLQITGAGPAGSAAALAALAESRAVCITERARAPRHKVCGEFISAEAGPVLEELGAWAGFVELGPARVRRCRLHFGDQTKEWTLGETAFGLSRLALDSLLLDRAVSGGALISRGGDVPIETRNPIVLASGRNPHPAARPRLFGFKAHFEGPADDAVELYFTDTGYIGINTVERSWTNVCGIAPENALRECGFEIDEFVRRTRPLAERLKPLTRCMSWLTTGPLVFSGFVPPAENLYPAGDALGFVDPFTGSGILNALLTGKLAGAAAAHGTPVPEYLRICGSLLGRPAAVSTLFRAALRSGFAHHLVRLVPGSWMYRFTRTALPV